MKQFKDLTAQARVIVCAFVVLVLAGIYDAFVNMPILSGCSFYGECSDNAAEGASGPDAAP